jgi:hypothetical protein
LQTHPTIPRSYTYGAVQSDLKYCRVFGNREEMAPFYEFIQFLTSNPYFEHVGGAGDNTGASGLLLGGLELPDS